MKIVIIEHNIGDLILLKEYLSLTGLSFKSIKSFHKINESKEVLRETLTDLVFVDIIFTSTLGNKEIKEISDLNPQLPIIVLCSITDQKAAIESLKFGAQDYLIKGEYDEKLLKKTILNSIERKKNNDSLIFKNKELNTFFYKASHDLRGPISSILGLTYVAKKEVKDEVGLNYIEMINNSAKKIDDILINFFELTTLRQANVNYDFIDIHQIILQNIDLVKLKIDFECEINFNLAEKTIILGDKKMINAIVRNILDNACYFRKIGQKHIVNIIFYSLYGKHYIEIEDNGQGIENTYLDKVFDMFYRANVNAKGSGLGLYIVKTFIDKMDGAIKITSTLNKETKVQVEFPIQNEYHDTFLIN